MINFNIDELHKAVTKASVLRVKVDLQPVSVDGLVYPPTYDQGQHLFRPAWIDGEEHDAVVLDSVQSQANRIELAILEAHRYNPEFCYPDISIEVNNGSDSEEYSVLELSHRIYDAALRLTLLDEQPFPESPIGKAVYSSRTQNATALLEHAPITLVLGGWDSHGGGGPLVAKLPRIISSEIIGLDAKPVSHGAVKFDPMDIRKDAGPLYQSKIPGRLMEVIEDKAQRNSTGKKDAIKYKDGNPSSAGLGNVPSMEERGAVITSAIQTSLLSVTALRRLRFPDVEGKSSDERHAAGRQVVAALGLYGLLAQMESGYNLRSRCDLIAKAVPKLEVMGQSLDDCQVFDLDATGALEILKAAIEHARNVGLKWRKETKSAVADDRLLELIQRSRNCSRRGE